MSISNTCHGGEFNGRRILKPETIDLMTKVNRLPEINAGGKGFRFGPGFECIMRVKNLFRKFQTWRLPGADCMVHHILLIRGIT